MKKLLIFVVLIMLGTIGYAVIGQSKKQPSPKEERREVREQRRAQRQAEFERTMDSIVLSRNFQFNPQTMQRQPAGSMKMLSNANFNLSVWDGSADIFLPYVKGYVPPYRYTILNYTVPSLQNYVTEQTDGGWTISFETSLFSASTYTFIFDVSSRFGGATLTIKNVWYDNVQYSGTISQVY